MQISSAILSIVVVCGLSYSTPILAQINPSDDTLQLTARYHIESGTNQGFVIVKFQMPEGNYIYSLTQPKPLRPSKLAIKANPKFQVGKKFQAEKKPKVVEKDPVFRSRVEKHSGTVQFYVPIQVDGSVDPSSVVPEIVFNGQVCSNQGFCKPYNNKVVRAKFAGYFQREAKSPWPRSRKK